MVSTSSKVPAKRMRTEGHGKTQIPQETMLEVLLWLDRFDLDGKQITTKRLRTLAENKLMPLRKVRDVDYKGEWRSHLWNSSDKTNTLSICLEKLGSATVELKIETDVDAQKAASYLSSCFVSDFDVYWHHNALPRNAVISAPALIGKLEFRECNFREGVLETLIEMLNGSTFQSLTLAYSSIPGGQINDKLLEWLRRRGCNKILVCPHDVEPDDDDEKFEMTEEGILGYCFTLDENLPPPKSRILDITWTTITPSFFKKVVEASKNSHLTCDVELSMEHLRFDAGKLDIGVPPSRSQEHDLHAPEDVHYVRYDIADHGNGMRLFIHFKSVDREKWEVVVRHGNKDHKEFFEPTEAEVEDDEDTGNPTSKFLISCGSRF